MHRKLQNVVYMKKKIMKKKKKASYRVLSTSTCAQLVVSLDKHNSYEAISCADNNHKMQEIVRSKNK